MATHCQPADDDRENGGRLEPELTPHRLPHDMSRSLNVLANGDIVADANLLSDGDLWLLDTFAAKASDAVWHLDAQRVLAAVEDGRELSTFRAFLAEHSEQDLPETVAAMLDELTQRIHALEPLGSAELIACSTAELADRIAMEPETRKLCLRAGERHVVVQEKCLRRFRTALRKLRYCFPAPRRLDDLAVD